MYTVVVDTLEIVCQGIPVIDSDVILQPDIKIEPNTDNKSPFYNNSYNINLNDEDIATLYCTPTSRLRYSIRDHCLIIVNNNVLYASDAGIKIQKVMDILQLKFYSYKTIHIAIDGVGMMEKQLNLKKQISFERLQKVHYSEVENEVLKSIIEIRLGSRYSNKYIVFYKKYTEALTRGKKYIIDYWKAAGIQEDNIKEMERVEIRLKKSELKNISSNLTLMLSADYLMSLFKKKAEKVLTFSNKDDKNELRSIIDWTKIITYDLNLKINKVKEVSHSVIKTIIKRLYLEYSRINYTPYRSSYLKLVNEYELKKWFDSKRKGWK